MAVFERASTHQFIQQAYREARLHHSKSVARAPAAAAGARLRTRPATPYARPDELLCAPPNAVPATTALAAPVDGTLIAPSAPEAEVAFADVPTSADASATTFATRDSTLLPYDKSSKRRVAMALVDLCTAYVEGLWPQRHNNCKFPLRKFICEILRRSRVQYPVFQVALCYLARLQPVIRACTDKGLPVPEKLSCGRRVLVAALQVAAKFLQDRCYSASVWARISGLPLDDLKRNELALMEALEWKLFVSYEAYTRSCARLRVSVDVAFVERAVAPAPPPAAAPLAATPVILTPEASPDMAAGAPPSPEVRIWNY